MHKYRYILSLIIAISQCFILGEIFLFSRPLEAKENSLSHSAESFFVCTTDTSVPTLYLYTSGKFSLTPLITWHQEYILPQDSGSKICEQVAEKLQDLYKQPGTKYISTEEKEEHTLVCMVKVENETCHSNYSEPLFSINPNYDVKCVLSHREPLECVSVGRVRGVFSIPDSPYKPIWWLW